MTKYEMIFVTGYKIAISPHSPDARSAHNTFPSTGLMTGPSKFWFELNQVVVYGLKHLILFQFSWIASSVQCGDNDWDGWQVWSREVSRLSCVHVSYPPHHIRNQSGDNVEILALMSWDKTERPTSDSDHVRGLTFHLQTIAAIYWFTF